MNREAFEAQLERVLAVALRLGQIVMMDNSSTQSKANQRDRREARVRAPIPSLLAGFQSYRRGLLEGQRALAQSFGS